MVNVDLRMLCNKLNPYCTNTLYNAMGLCTSRTHYEIGVEHWLVKFLEDRTGDLAALFENNQEVIGTFIKELNVSLDTFPQGCGGKPGFSPKLVDLLSDAWLVSSIDLGLAQIRSAAIIIAILEHPMIYGQESWYSVLKTINVDKLKANLATYTAKSAEALTPVSGSEGASAEGKEKGGNVTGGFIDRFCTDFTAKAREGKLDPVFGRDDEIRQMVDILARRRKNNPILVGEPGVGKTAVLEGLSLRIVEGDVPEILKDVRLIGLDMGLLEAGAGVKGEFENRLKGVITEIQASTTPIILFIDEAHTLIGAGGSAGTSDAANLLKPALARGELRTCAATTWSEYKKYFEKDPALARRFQPVKLAEPSTEITTLILRGLKKSYEKAHHVVIRDDALKVAAEYADRYITARFLPDKAIDLVDTACARVKVNLKAMPGSVENIRRKSQAIAREISSLQRDIDNDVSQDLAKLEELKNDLAINDKLYEEKHGEWQKELDAVNAVVEARQALFVAKEELAKDADNQELKDKVESALAQVHELTETLQKIQGDNPQVHYEVTPDLIGQVVSDWTGIPLGRMARDELTTVLNLDSILTKKVKGQEFGIKTMTTVLKNAKAGLKSPEQPLGVFLLVGPSGVGKTETAINLAKELFGNEHSLITINMSEYQEKHTVSRLVGAPPGYVGYGEGGLLTEAVRKQPYSVVLLDEVEKAHPDILNIFYQVFDKGVLNDGEGKEINFANTVILLTSNLATDVISEMSLDPDCTVQNIIDAIRPILNNHFKPALLARMTVLPYKSLSKEALHDITILKLNKLAKLLQKNNGIKLSYADEIVEQIVERCKDAETGARNIDLIINVNLLPKLSAFVLQALSSGEVPAEIGLSLDENKEFAMAVK